MKPLIAVNLDISSTDASKVRVNRTYLEAVQRAGGMPFLVPPMKQADLKSVCKMVHGFLFIGGPDYAPSLYGEDSHPTVKTLPLDRQELDLRLMALALSSTDDDGNPKPILGICGGHQLLNIALGGSLIQDIEAARPGTGSIHATTMPRGRHGVKLVAGTQIARIFASGCVDGITTSHHQAVKRLGEGLKACGFSDDGIIEVIEHERRPFTIGVQWHPEVDFELNEPLFRAFLSRSRKMNV